MAPRRGEGVLVVGPKGRAALRRGHPWVWASSAGAVPELPAGSIVAVRDGTGAFLARALLDPASPIVARVLTRRDEAVDGAFVRRRVEAAARLRAGLFDPTETDAYRLVHGEADRLPGVVCDLYGAVAVVKYDGAAAALSAWVREALAALPGARRVVERRDRRRGAHAAPRPAEGSAGDRVVIREGGLRFEVDLVAGHKTGFYLDQRESRARVRDLARGRRVLNLFAYTGGFSVAAAAGGALSTLSVEIAGPAAAAARRNLALNGLDPERHRVLQADVMELLKTGPVEGGPWDLVVVDPPSFAPSRAALPKALAAYRRLNEAVLRGAPEGGLVLTCSCSAHVGREAFARVVDEAAAGAGVHVRVVAEAGPPADHPVLRAFPEGDYLKVLLLERLGDARRSRPRHRGAHRIHSRS